jgi:hypothetical protein
MLGKVFRRIGWRGRVGEVVYWVRGQRRSVPLQRCWSNGLAASLGTQGCASFRLRFSPGTSEVSGAASCEGAEKESPRLTQLLTEIHEQLQNQVVVADPNCEFALQRPSYLM